LLLVPVLLLACNAESDGEVGRGSAEEHRDASPDADGSPNPAADGGIEPIESRIAEALSSEEFREATCRIAGVVAHANDPTVSCETVEKGCLGTVDGLDASAFGAAIPVPDQTVDLGDCQVTAAQADACMAELVGVVVTMADGLGCGMDAGLPELGPELLLTAPSCLVVALTCPELLEGLFPATMTAGSPAGGATGAR
jgi:hypothetical protein